MSITKKVSPEQEAEVLLAAHDNQTDEEECDHDDVEDFTCLDCGADRFEAVMSAAYDRAKDRRKYGH